MGESAHRTYSNRREWTEKGLTEVTVGKLMEANHNKKTTVIWCE